MEEGIQTELRVISESGNTYPRSRTKINNQVGSSAKLLHSLCAVTPRSFAQVPRQPGAGDWILK